MTAARPKRPQTVVVGPKEYSIGEDAAETSKAEADAVCIARHEEIWLAPDLSEGTQRVHVVHELLHACFDDAKVGGPIGSDAEEKACLALAPRVVEVLRRNPALVRWVTA